MENFRDEVDGFYDEIEGYDAVVVGSGYGGSVAAYRISMAGIKVCLIEKGRRWESRDFPTNSFQILSETRLVTTNYGISHGRKDGLFQIYEQGDSLAGVCCGLGGGSLVNAGVIVSTPIRARRNPKWPKEWEKDWEVCEASASSILKPQSVPIEFSNATVMREIAEEEIEESRSSSITLSINFSNEEGFNGNMRSQQLGNCLACGNCLSGCPYNAKNSTDKNYLASAIQAGCIVKTECQVQYVVKSPDEDTKDRDVISRKRRRRWRVYFNDLEYLCCDFVVLSAGVLGTAEILFQSQRRGLRLSERLGFGFSCNGNNVGYVSGSPAPLNGFGLNKKQFSNIPFQNRPGPAISSSYTSSLGFTIQSGVIPTSYPCLLFKGLASYGWPPGYWFLHGFIDKLKHMMGLKASQAILLNAMGYDEADGRITLNEDTNKITFSSPYDSLLLRKIQTLQKLTKRLRGILFMSKYRSTSVHLLGGCNSALDSSQGVCNPNGQVFNPKSSSSTVHSGLYVCDASLIPCSIGINPCLTIATVAEHISKHLVQDILNYKSQIWPIQIPVAELQIPVDKNQATSKTRSGISRMLANELRAKTVTIRETMRGHLGGMPCAVYLTMKMGSGDQKGHGEGTTALGEPHPLLRGRVSGYVVFKFVQKDKLYIVDGEVDMCKVDNRTPYTQYMHYCLLLASASGSRYILEGKKIMNPYLLGCYAWNESRTMYVTFKTVPEKKKIEIRSNSDLTEEMVDLKGELHLSVVELLRSLISMRGDRRATFISLLLQSLLRTYILQTPRGSSEDLFPTDIDHRPYPPSIRHEIRTEDGFIICCRQWRCNHSTWRSERERQTHPVLLLNGHSTESYWLPTEPHDLVRTLQGEGYEVWLLQPRCHPLNPSNGFTIEDIGKFDIPAAFAKICELHGTSVKLHVVAHCVGGLAVHIALLGGHISATQIASLSCTNSSMFFKVTTSSLVKMRLPLIPISMVILGKNRIISMFEKSKNNLRHRLLKAIARLIPRCERCTCDECEVFSGIFGNAFWHDKVSPTMHHWLNKKSLPSVPMSAFPHLRKICIAGFLVDPNGKNTYLIHPERMAVTTLYISGGRSLLVTPQTTFLANQYMKLHQPGFQHKRVVVEDFGHSDLWIGEESYKRVFPHILSHIKVAEQGNNGPIHMDKLRYSKKSLAWDASHDGNGVFGAGVSLVMLLFLLLLLFFYLT